MAMSTSAAIDSRRRLNQPLANIDAMFYLALAVMTIGTFLGVFVR